MKRILGNPAGGVTTTLCQVPGGALVSTGVNRAFLPGVGNFATPTFCGVTERQPTSSVAPRRIRSRKIMDAKRSRELKAIFITLRVGQQPLCMIKTFLNRPQLPRHRDKCLQMLPFVIRRTHEPALQGGVPFSLQTFQLCGQSTDATLE